MKNLPAIQRLAKRTGLLVAAGAATFLAVPAHAVNFEWGDFEGSADLVFSAGATWRTQERDNSIVAKRNQPGLGGEGGLCADEFTGGPAGTGARQVDPTLDRLGGCALSQPEHQDFVDTPGYSSQNGDNGNLNYDKGDIVASAFKLTTDLSGSYGDAGFSARFIGFYDWENDGRREFHPDSGTAHGHQREFSEMNRGMEDAMVFNAAMEEANAYYNWDLWDRGMSLTVGRKALSWGESLTFPIGSINSNTIPSLIRLNTPGGDLKELFVPVNQIVYSTDVTDEISMEAFYQLEFEPITNHLPAANSFFSTSDTAGLGGTYAMLSFGKEPEDPDNLQDNNFVDDGNGFNALAGRGCVNTDENIYNGTDATTSVGGQDEPLYRNPNNSDAENDAQVARAQAHRNEFGPYVAHRGETTFGRTICRRDREGEWKDQWGVKFKAYSETLNDTEFGFYYMNYTSRLPYASFIGSASSGSAADAQTFAGIQGILDATDPASGSDPAEIAAATAQLATFAADLPTDLLNALAVADSVSLVLEYPEDIEMFGMSFNTTVGDLSISGEYAYRPDYPIQLSTVDLTLYALGPAFNSLRALAGGTFVERYRAPSRCTNGETESPDFAYNHDDPRLTDGSNGANPYPACSRINGAEFVPGYERFNVGHGSTTILWSSSQNPWGADQWLLIGDMSATKVFGMPDKGTLKFSAPGDDLGGNFSRNEYDQAPLSDSTGAGAAALEVIGAIVQNPDRENDATFADSFSWGYRVLSILKYNNAVFGYNWEQLLGFFHDVNGNSPGPGGDFVEGRKRYLWGTKLVKGPWTLEGKYTWFTGAGDRNQERDRDNFQASVRYTF